jgi:hypothetical protein
VAAITIHRDEQHDSFSQLHHGFQVQQNQIKKPASAGFFIYGSGGFGGGSGNPIESDLTSAQADERSVLDSNF